MAEQYASIDSALKAAIDRDQDAKEAYRTAHIAEMNAMADAMIEQGPLPNFIGRRAFLFAMHGAKEEWQDDRKGAPQVRYEEIEKRFGFDHISQAFSLSHDFHNHGEPFRLFAYQRQQYHDWLRHHRPRGEEFSAVEYEITQELGMYVGRIALSASSIDMAEFNVNHPDRTVADPTTIRQTRATILKIKRGPHTDQTEPSVPFDGKTPEIRYGKSIAAWAEKQYGLAHYVRILENVAEAEELLTAPAADKSA